jgi:TetR/AcrR family transcriptional repressor of mexJK operon
VSISLISPLLPADARPRRAGRPSRAVAEALPEQILARARALFLEHGFAATSVQQIAAQAGATKRTLYVKVGDKEALFRAVIDDVLKDWRHTVDEAAHAGPLQVRLEAIGQQLLAVVLSPDMVRLNRVLTSEAYRFPSLIQMLVRQIEQGPIPQLARLLMAERGGHGLPALEDEIAARLFYDMVSGAPLRVALTGRQKFFEMPDADWVRHAVAVFLRGWGHTS